MKTIIAIISLLSLTACSSDPIIPVIENKLPVVIATPTPTPTPTETPKKEIDNFDVEFQNSLKDVWGSYFKENYNDSRSIDIFIATNRVAKTEAFGCTNSYYGVTENNENKLNFGICRINVPKNHSTGEIEFTTDRRASSHRFYKVVRAKQMNLDEVIDFFKRTKRTPLIFVHGFNVKYQDAVLRSAQITYDLKYQGPVMLFTWPSGAGDGFFDDKFLNKTYEQNQKSAKNSVKLFKEIMLKLGENNLPANIIIHSMGHQVVLPALNLLGKENGNLFSEKKLVNELILSAPDYEINEFQNNVDSIKKLTKRITLYCSYNDKAMVASSTINNNERLGACANVEGVDTINVSLIDDKTFGTGHSYYAGREIITDVFQVLLGLEVEKRLFMKKSEPNSTEKYYLRN